MIIMQNVFNIARALLDKEPGEEVLRLKYKITAGEQHYHTLVSSNKALVSLLEGHAISKPEGTTVITVDTHLFEQILHAVKSA